MNMDRWRKTKAVSVAMDESLYQRLRESAARDNQTMSKQCRVFIRAALELREKLITKK